MVHPRPCLGGCDRNPLEMFEQNELTSQDILLESGAAV